MYVLVFDGNIMRVTDLLKDLQQHERWRDYWTGAEVRSWIPGYVPIDRVKGDRAKGISCTIVRPSFHFLISEWPSPNARPQAPP